MKDRVFELCDIVRETGFAIHQYLGPGHLEKVYENAFVNRLSKQGLEVKQQHRLEVRDEDGTVLGEYAADLFIENSLIVELKAARDCADEHVAQLLGYLRASRVEHGLLVNFGAAKFQIKKYVLSDPNAKSFPAFSWLLTFLILFASLCVFCGQSVFAAEPKTVRLLTIGNSFSANATKYLADLAKGGGRTLVHRPLGIGGAPMEVHGFSGIRKCAG
jgi:GxxExxY protein